MRSSIRALLTVGSVAVLNAGVVVTPASAAPPDPPQRFIVTVVDGVDSRDVAADHRRGGADIDFVYRTALNGFAGAMSQAQLGELRHDQRVTRIERDGVVQASGTQVGPTWGLDRIDDRAGLDGSYVYDQTGAGVHAYVVDTGIRLTHAEFTGRLAGGYDAVTAGGTANDCNGHGTHVAGTVGGVTYGVAKAVTLHPVRVLDCNGSGSWSGVIAGLDWVAAHHVAPAVANLSLGGGASSSVDAAVEGAIASGVTVVVAAGNGNRAGRAQDACDYSPARVPAALTIGATTREDTKTSWSNYGSCVDLFAPGAGITSAWYDADAATNTISGTSMAAPHVAGVAALYLQAAPTALPAAVAGAIHDASTQHIVTSSSTAKNHLLHSSFSSGTGTGNAAPTATFTYSCTELTCTFTSTSADSDGGIAGHSWGFGDETGSSESTPVHTYAAASTYTVTLTVTDDAGATGSTSQAVTVTTPSAGAVSLSATGYKVKGVQHVDLTWAGAGSSTVDVFRDGTMILTTANDGAYTHNLGTKGGGTSTYTVCESGTSTCSGEVTVSF